MADKYNNFISAFSFNSYQKLVSIVVIATCFLTTTIILLIPIMTIEPDFKIFQNNQLETIQNRELFCNTTYYEQPFQELYDKIIIDDSKVYNWGSELKIICNNSLIFSLPSSFYFLGSMISNLCLTQFVDLFGRKHIFIVLNFVLMIAHINLLFLFHYSQIIISSFFIGMSSLNISIGIIIINEYNEEKHSNRLIGLINGSFPFAGIVFASIIYFFSNYRIFIIITNILSILSFFLALIFLKETPKWLLLNHRYHEFLYVVNYMAKYEDEKRRKELILIFKKFLYSKHNFEDSQGIIQDNVNYNDSKILTYEEHSFFNILIEDTFKFTSFKLLGIWIITGICFYGLILRMTGITNSYYLDSILTYSAIFFSATVSGYYAGKYGINLMLYSFLATSISSFLIQFITNFWINIILLFIAVFGMGSAFNLLFIFSITFYPDNIKSNTLTLFVIFSRVASALIPLIFGMTDSFLTVVGFFSGIACVLSLVLPKIVLKKSKDAFFDINETESGNS